MLLSLGSEVEPLLLEAVAWPPEKFFWPLRAL